MALINHKIIIAPGNPLPKPLMEAKGANNSCTDGPQKFALF